MSEHRSSEKQDEWRDQRPAQNGSGASAWLLLLRVGLPTTLIVAGLILALAGIVLVGIVLVGTGVIAAVVDFFARMTNESELDRDREEQARRTYMSTGSWPRRRR